MFSLRGFCSQLRPTGTLGSSQGDSAVASWHNRVFDWYSVYISGVTCVCVSKNVEEEVTPAAFGLMSFLNWS